MRVRERHLGQRPADGGLRHDSQGAVMGWAPVLNKMKKQIVGHGVLYLYEEARV